MNEENEEIVWLHLIREGDQLAFKRIFYRYVDALVRFVSFYIHDKARAEELVLDIFTYIWENRQTFEIRLTWKAYLFQAAKNKVYTYIRDKKDAFYIEELSTLEISQSDSDIEMEELHGLIREAVSLLPPKCKEIFRKSRDELLTNKEIASQLHISEKTVEGQITIALKKIRTYLGDMYAYLW